MLSISQLAIKLKTGRHFGVSHVDGLPFFQACSEGYEIVRVLSMYDDSSSIFRYKTEGRYKHSGYFREYILWGKESFSNINGFMVFCFNGKLGVVLKSNQTNEMDEKIELSSIKEVEYKCIQEDSEIIFGPRIVRFETTIELHCYEFVERYPFRARFFGHPIITGECFHRDVKPMVVCCMLLSLAHNQFLQ